jgi:hypothetical protein
MLIWLCYVTGWLWQCQEQAWRCCGRQGCSTLLNKSNCTQFMMYRRVRWTETAVPVIVACEDGGYVYETLRGIICA